jgi:hypothetical protein
MSKDIDLSCLRVRGLTLNDNNQRLCCDRNGSPMRVEIYWCYIDAKARVYDAIHLEQSHCENSKQVIYQPLLDLIVNVPDDSWRGDK